MGILTVTARCYGLCMARPIDEQASNIADARGIAGALSLYRFGRGDPTTRLDGTEFWRATLTPDGPATLHLSWATGALDAEAWGAGSQWMLDRVEALTGARDQPPSFADAHPVIARAAHRHPHLRLGASGTLYHELLPTILGQRITAGEAILQWHRLVRRLGEPAPGPHADLLLPPAPTRLAGRPAWWFHPLGIEAKRAEPLRTVARHADRLWQWAVLSPTECAAKLALLPGLGRWTIGSVLGPALGDPDAVPVGDYHLKNLVAYALAGRPRGTDDEMLDLLAPYAGQRGRVLRLLQLDGHSPPTFGPRQRILPLSRW